MSNEGNFKSFQERFAPRSTVPAPPAPPVATGEHVAYEAFGAKDRVYRLDLRSASGVAHALPYSHLLLFTYDRKSYAELFLTISGVAATVKGRNLRPIVEALKLHSCEFIQAFDPEEFLEPEDSTQPLVESIEVEIIRRQEQTRGRG